MNLQEMIDAIEGTDFDIRYMILSSFSTVLLSLQTDKVLKDLIALMSDNFDYQSIILRRIEALMPDYQSSFRHTHDTAITAYLYSLQAVKSNGALEQVIYKIAKQYEFWWARKLAQKIVQEQAIYTTHTQVIVFQATRSNSNSDYVLSTKTTSTFSAIPA